MVSMPQNMHFDHCFVYIFFGLAWAFCFLERLFVSLEQVLSEMEQIKIESDEESQIPDLGSASISPLVSTTSLIVFLDVITVLRILDDLF